VFTACQLKNLENSMKNMVRKILPITAGLVIALPAWSTTQPVPEPNIMALFGVGIAAAILIARYMKKK
jgi:hypothetical protein